MVRAQYERRGPVPQDVIQAVELEAPTLRAGEALVKVVAAPINPSDLLTLTGEYGLVAAGTLWAPIHATYDVGEIREAVAAAASGRRSGKILIVPRG